MTQISDIWLISFFRPVSREVCIHWIHYIIQADSLWENISSLLIVKPLSKIWCVKICRRSHCVDPGGDPVLCTSPLLRRTLGAPGPWWCLAVLSPLHICWAKSTFRTFCSPSTPVASTQPSRPSENPSTFARPPDHTTWNDGFFFWGLYFGPLLLWIVYDLLMSICLTLQPDVDRWISKMWKPVIVCLLKISQSSNSWSSALLTAVNLSLINFTRPIHFWRQWFLHWLSHS